MKQRLHGARNCATRRAFNPATKKAMTIASAAIASFFNQPGTTISSSSRCSLLRLTAAERLNQGAASALAGRLRMAIKMVKNNQIRVLFVCMGNICRSPTAEAVLRRLLQLEAPELAVTIDSAATHDYHVGRPPDPRSQTAAR